MLPENRVKDRSGRLIAITHKSHLCTFGLIGHIREHVRPWINLCSARALIAGILPKRLRQCQRVAPCLFGRGFGPKLIAIAEQRLEVDATNADREKSSVLARQSAQVCFIVRCADQYHRARNVDSSATIGGARSVCLACDRGLDLLNVSTLQADKLGHFDAPSAAQCLLKLFVLNPENGLITEILATEQLCERRRLAITFRAFQNNHAIKLGARLSNASHRCDHKQTRDTAIKRSVFGSEVCRKHFLNARLPVPHKA